MGIDTSKMQKKADKMGAFGGFFLGVLFALAMCPVSAALFFGSLIPVALSFNSRFVIPLSYGMLRVFLYSSCHYCKLQH
jgi:hypothetical protein